MSAERKEKRCIPESHIAQLIRISQGKYYMPGQEILGAMWE
jgi:hypothetical protein